MPSIRVELARSVLPWNSATSTSSRLCEAACWPPPQHFHSGAWSQSFTHTALEQHLLYIDYDASASSLIVLSSAWELNEQIMGWSFNRCECSIQFRRKAVPVLQSLTLIGQDNRFELVPCYSCYLTLCAGVVSRCCAMPYYRQQCWVKQKRCQEILASRHQNIWHPCCWSTTVTATDSL